MAHCLFSYLDSNFGENLHKLRDFVFPIPTLGNSYGNELYNLTLLYVIYQTQETVFHRDIQAPRRELKIRRTAQYFFRNSRCLDSR